MRNNWFSSTGEPLEFLYIDLMLLDGGALTLATSIVECICHSWKQLMKCIGRFVTFAWISGLARYLDETVVEGEVMTNGILPGGEPIAVIREAVHDELTNTAQC